ncbi:MAG TPA: NAD(P)/FAD-dependent oxidoreductase [Pseudonocardia sp.]|jgi:cation diffusion facilitator CzcD-associated flavoprotein CzcO|nr:NAD(P)/FAD-dependent oxidoreductase [Pseudonocardia sp.]
MAQDFTPDLDAVVIGAGFSGLYMLKRLRDDLGLSVRVFEAADGVGGTWYWNRYPGARCDSDSFMYCYSFDPDLLQEWQWSGKYPEQAELRAYLEHVADRFDLRRDITLGTRVTAAHYHDESATWLVQTDSGESVRVRYLITGIGHLSISRYVPKFAGLDTFEGDWYHTAGWPQEGVDLTGKRVGVVGTGSSGVQSIPVMAKQAEHLTVFQRTPQYSIPARHETVDDAFWRDVKSRYSELFERSRTSAGGFPWQHNGTRALDVSHDERTAVYEKAWAEGGFKFALGTFRDVAYNIEANQTMSDFMREKIREAVDDPETREKLIPTHPFLSRRPIVDTYYFETYNRPNVDLVDVRAAPIQEITPRGLRTAEAEYELDVIVFATGFDAVTGPFFGIDLTGSGGTRLVDRWSAGPTSYLGLQTSDFPNMFMITGPGSTLGNLPLTIETHVDWITECIAAMRRDGLTRIEAVADSEQEWTEHVNAEAGRSLIPLADSWYNGSNIPGKARAYVFYFGHFGRYRGILHQVAQDNYPGFVLA